MDEGICGQVEPCMISPMTRAARLMDDIKQFLSGPKPNPQRPPMSTHRAKGRKRKSRNPIHVSTQQKKLLGQAVRSKGLGVEERNVLKKLDRNINTQLTDREMALLRSAASCPSLRLDQQMALDNLVAHQYNNGRGLE